MNDTLSIPQALAQCRRYAVEAVADLLDAADACRQLLGLPPLPERDFDGPATPTGLVRLIGSALSATVESFAQVREAVGLLCHGRPETVAQDTEPGEFGDVGVNRVIEQAAEEWDRRNGDSTPEKNDPEQPAEQPQETPASEPVEQPTTTPAEEPADDQGDEEAAETREEVAACVLAAEPGLGYAQDENCDGTLPVAVPVVTSPDGLHRRLTRQNGDYAGSHYYKSARPQDLVPGARLWQRGGTGKWHEVEYRPPVEEA